MAAAMDNRSGVEIGVLEECDSFLLESRFFPSKLGGKPAWLDLKNLPTDLTCGVCSKPCIFLCQVYAPLDDNPTSHHRTIYIFVCPDAACCKQNENPSEEESWHPECRVENFSRVCTLCGNPAPFNCSKCKSALYCSKDHQVAHWKQFGHREECCKTVTEKKVEVPPLLFPQWEITLDKPPEEEQAAKTEAERLAEYNTLVAEGQAGTMESTSAEALEQYSMVKDDKYFRKYRKCISDCPEQVLRYDRGGTPLYAAKPHWDESKIPKCPYCKGERQFEFQLMSTMLNEMGQTDLQSLDWGTLLVYTCKGSCSGEPAYKTEYLIKQDITDD